MNYKDFEKRLQATAPGSEAEQKVYDELLADLRTKAAKSGSFDSTCRKFFRNQD